MKKMIIIFLIIVCSCGIGFVGYLIFNSKNIDTVELAGNMQTLYVVGDEIDFEDAKLKVTYKNGNIKMIDLDRDTVEIKYFSTSVETFGKMDIIYKSAVLPVEYKVIQKGAYYLSKYNSKEIVPQGNNLDNIDYKNVKYLVSTTSEIIYLESGGVCKYYTKSADKWFMNDGNYNKNYKYTITGDTMSVKLGDSEYNIKVNYLDTGKMELVSKELTGVKDTDLVRKQVEKTFEHTAEMKTNQSVGSAKVCYGKDLVDEGSIQFKIGDTLEKADKNIYIQIIQPQDNSGHQFRIIYVKVHDAMVSNNFDTSKVQGTSTYATLTYGGKTNLAMYYTVVK